MVLCVAAPRLIVWLRHAGITIYPSLRGGVLYWFCSRGRDRPDRIPHHALVGLWMTEMTDSLRSESRRVPVHEVGPLNNLKRSYACLQKILDRCNGIIRQLPYLTN